MSTCQHCGIEVESKQRGRPVNYCSDRCRKATSRKGNLRKKKQLLNDCTGLQNRLKKSTQKQRVACPEAAQRMVVSGLHDYRVTDGDAPDLNNLSVQCNHAIDQTNVVRASPRIEVLSDSEVEPDLLRYIIWVECGV